MSRNSFRNTSLAFATVAALATTFAALPALGAPSTHQVVRVKNSTTAPIKISYLSASGSQKWEDLAVEAYTDADVKRGAANNILVQLVATGAANQANTQLATPPAGNPPDAQIRVNNATAAKATVSFYSPPQKWVAIDPNTFSDVVIAKGPAGHLLLQFVPNQ